MSAMASQITGVSIVCSTVGSGADQRKHQSSASLAFVWGIHRWPVNSPHKWSVTQKMFPIDDVITTAIWLTILTNCITLITDGDGRTDTARRKRERPMGSKRTWSAAVWQCSEDHACRACFGSSNNGPVPRRNFDLPAFHITCTCRS